ncbi:MAG TPA: helix-turn-helix transcriptional regulator [Acidimicrobiales bacterium]|nr:helix-turn-helix transcriptional regulator [Acidimicrobiales bacterium]
MVIGAATALLSTGDLTILDVRCGCPAGRVEEEEVPGFEIVLPVSGVFRRRAANADVVADAGAAYAGVPGSTQRIEHVTAGDRGLVACVSERLAVELGIESAPALARTRAIDRLIASARRSIDEEDWLVGLASLSSVTVVVAPTADRRRAVDRVREAIGAAPGERWTLRSLADVAGYSPHHLSRVFRACTGTTVSEHRDRVRLARAAELAADGMALAEVAAACGFADHGHLTRRARAVLGTVPSRLRA